MIISSQKTMKKKARVAIIAGVIIAVVIGIGAIDTISLKPTTDTQPSNGDTMLMHIHPRMYLNVDGKPYMIPQNVGIDADMWKDHSLDQYGMQGMAPMHTHTADGMIHIESKVIRNYTLGKFLDIWGLDLKDKTVSVTSFGEPVSDYRNHVLKDDEVIIMNITSNH